MSTENELIANSDYTEAEIFGLSPYDEQANPTGVKDGQLFFATNTKKLFLSSVSGTAVNWSVIESTRAGTSDVNDIFASSAPSIWLDAQSSATTGSAGTGERLKAVRDRSGNDFHYVSNLSSKQFTLSVDNSTKFFDLGSLSYSSVRYRCVDQMLTASGMRIGAGLTVQNGACSFLAVFKSKKPWAVSRVDGKPYEECTTHEERLQCGASDNTSHQLLPLYNLGYGQYVHSSHMKYGGAYYNYLSSNINGAGSMTFPKAGIFNNTHEQWNTLFIRSASEGKAAEILINGKNFIGLSLAMKEGATKLGLQADWANGNNLPSDNPAFQTTGSTWLKNGENQVNSSYLLSSGGTGADNLIYWNLPYAEPAYEFYPADLLDGVSGTSTSAVAVNGHRSGTHSGVRYSSYQPWNPWFSSAVNVYSGNFPGPSVYRGDTHSVDAINAPFDLAGNSQFSFAECAMWSKRLDDTTRDGVLAQIHEKYKALGSGMPDLPGGNSSPAMMPSKTSLWDAPWI